MSDFDFDVVVIGSGPGGYVASIRASQLGAKVCIIEKDKLGGVCLNIGCIPSKALIHYAELFRRIPAMEQIGLKVDASGFDYSKVLGKTRKAADTLSRGVNYLMKKNNITVIKGTGRIAGLNEVTVDNGKLIKAKNIIIAAGSRSVELPDFPIDEKKVLSSTGALLLDKLPASMIILGAGAIGIEFAHVMNAFGADVHVVEMLDNILPLADEEAAGLLRKSLEKRGIKISTGHKACKMENNGDTINVTIEDKEGKKVILTAGMVLTAVGRAPNTDDLGLENVGIQTEKGFIPVLDYYQTKVRGIFAIGDVVASPLLAHVASKEGEIAAEYIAGKKPQETQIDPLTIPDVVYSEPQVAGFGYTEQEAKKRGIEYSKAAFPYRASGKAVAMESPDGMVKILFDPGTKEIIGGHAVGKDATEIIHEMLLAKTQELMPENVADMIHAHPTLSEIVMEVMKAAEGRAIHI